MICDQIVGQEWITSTVNLADAKARLSELVGQAEAGDTVRILRRGKTVAQLTPARSARIPIDPAVLRAVTNAMTPGKENAGDMLRKMRDDERY